MPHGGHLAALATFSYLEKMRCVAKHFFAKYEKVARAARWPPCGTTMASRVAHNVLSGCASHAREESMYILRGACVCVLETGCSRDRHFLAKYENVARAARCPPWGHDDGLTCGPQRAFGLCLTCLGGTHVHLASCMRLCLGDGVAALPTHTLSPQVPLF